MTLARVGMDYPVDNVVNYFLDNNSDWNFGKVTQSRFSIDFFNVYTATPTESINSYI